MHLIPGQDEIDAVAHFCVAARQLRSSPFFTEEYVSLGFSMVDGDVNTIKVKLPDQNVQTAVLVPFRRIWAEGEPCYYLRVSNIVKRYLPRSLSFVEEFVIKKKAPLAPWLHSLPDHGLTFEETIDLWLNTQYMHVGKKARAGKYGREDFERRCNEIGASLFEHHFLVAVQVMGICFFNLLQVGERFLSECEAKGVTPSFEPPAEDDTKVDRSTPGFTPADKSLAHRVWRLRRRWRHSDMGQFLDLLECSDIEAADMMCRCDSLDGFLALCDIGIAQKTDLLVPKPGKPVRSIFVTDAPGMTRTPTQIANVRRAGKLLSLGEGALKILRDRYGEFRAALLDDDGQTT